MSDDEEQTPAWARALHEGLEALRGEVAHGRAKEPAPQSNPKASPKTERKKGGKTRTLRETFIPVGTNAQLGAGFQETVAEVLRCDGLAKKFKKALGCTHFQHINEHGEGLCHGVEGHRNEIFACIFENAAWMGQGQRLLLYYSPPCAMSPTLVRLPFCASPPVLCFAVLPAESDDDDEDDEDDEGDESDEGDRRLT